MLYCTQNDPQLSYLYILRANTVWGSIIVTIKIPGIMIWEEYKLYSKLSCYIWQLIISSLCHEADYHSKDHQILQQFEEIWFLQGAIVLCCILSRERENIFCTYSFSKLSHFRIENHTKRMWHKGVASEKNVAQSSWQHPCI